MTGTYYEFKPFFGFGARFHNLGWGARFLDQHEGVFIMSVFPTPLHLPMSEQNLQGG